LHQDLVEQQRGKRLGEVMKDRIFDPLDMKDIAFTMSDSMAQRRVTIHDRAADGKVTPLPDLILPQPPEMDCAGHGLYAIVGEYMKFIRMILSDGVGPNGRVLKSETVTAMSRDGLVDMGLSRPVGSLMWAGLGNLFFWIDRKMASVAIGPARSCHSRMRLPTRGLSNSRPPSTIIGELGGRHAETCSPACHAYRRRRQVRRK
jgi:CubicO group peptidase (beta-lactamase class C family)